MDDIKLDWLDLLITERCNFKCHYCFHQQKPKDMTLETLDNTLDYLKPIISEKCAFNFFGGEPTLRVDFMSEAVKRIREKFPKSTFHISTNLSNWSEELIELFDKYFNNFSIQISYDGIDQEKNRGHSYLVRNNMKKCVERFGPKKSATRLTFTQDTVCNLYDSMIDIYNLGQRKAMHSAEFIPGWTQQHYDIYKEQLFKIYDFIRTHQDFSVKFADCKIATASREKTKCSMGTSLLSISADGRIFPCHRAVAHEELCIGDVNKRYLNRGIFVTLKADKCDYCDCKHACHSCLVASYKYNGSMREPMDCVCAINHIEFEKATEEYKDKFGDEQNAFSILEKMLPVLEDIHGTNQRIITMIGSI